MGVKFCVFLTHGSYFLHTKDFGSFLFLGAEKRLCKWHNFLAEIG